MGFMDKVKAQADQLAVKAQHGVAQGQAKFEELQNKRKADALLRDLGAAVYAAQRTGGEHEPIEKALAALDAHVAEHGPIDTEAGASTPDAPDAPDAPAGEAAPSE